MSDLPPRVMNDPKALRAIAHPMRLRILEELVFHGPSTATELAELTGESPANCSWHLRQLAKYGFVEEAGGGTGRQRPWQMVIQQKSMPQGEVGEDLGLAMTQTRQLLVAGEYEALRNWLANLHTEPPDWADAAYVLQNVGWCTAEELIEVRRDVSKAMERFVDRINHPERRPAGARPVRFFGWGIPARGQ